MSDISYLSSNIFNPQARCGRAQFWRSALKLGVPLYVMCVFTAAPEHFIPKDTIRTDLERWVFVVLFAAGIVLFIVGSLVALYFFMLVFVLVRMRARDAGFYDLWPNSSEFLRTIAQGATVFALLLLPLTVVLSLIWLTVKGFSLPFALGALLFISLPIFVGSAPSKTTTSPHSPNPSEATK